MRFLYPLLVALVVAAYGYVGFTGWEIGASEREPIPPSVRQSPGGYRSYFFWHSGYQGGK